MAQSSIFSSVLIGHACCINDNYRLFCFEEALFSYFYFFSVYSRKRSLPYNYQFSQNIKAKLKVVGVFIYVT
ncbi:MAG: hypothetical protein ACTS7E_01745 [Arsenophonus sp. NC-CH8-MAG3]